MRTAPVIQLADLDRSTLERWARGRSNPARLVLRAKIVLLAAAGRFNQEIARELRCGNKTVSLWRSRFANQGLAGIEKDAPRGPGRRTTSDPLVQRIIYTTLHESPTRRRRWSIRSLAAELGTSPAMVQRVWKSHGLSSRSSEVTLRHKSPSA
jgi:transposase